MQSQGDSFSLGLHGFFVLGLTLVSTGFWKAAIKQERHEGHGFTRRRILSRHLILNERERGREGGNEGRRN